MLQLESLAELPWYFLVLLPVLQALLKMKLLMKFWLFENWFSITRSTWHNCVCKNDWEKMILSFAVVSLWSNGSVSVWSPCYALGPELWSKFSFCSQASEVIIKKKSFRSWMNNGHGHQLWAQANYYHPLPPSGYNLFFFCAAGSHGSW
jgi:hypothetical protein